MEGKIFKEMLVSMIGALPPLKGNAYYCMSLAKEMSRKVGVDFISFKKLYPEFLYPGGVSEVDENFSIQETSTLSIRRIITYYNPLSWIRAGLIARGEVVHIQWWSIPIAPIYLVTLLILKIRKKKIIFTVHNVIPHEPTVVDRICTKSVLSFGDAFLVHSNVNCRALVSNFGLPETSIYEVHMPVHDMYGGKSVSKKEARRKIGIPELEKVILSFGNIREYKGIDTLIEALPHVLKGIPQARLLIVGQPWKGWERCSQLIDDMQLEEKIHCVLEYVPMSEVKIIS